MLWYWLLVSPALVLALLGLLGERKRTRYVSRRLTEKAALTPPATVIVPLKGYDEGLLLYILGLGSPTYPLPPESFAAYCATYQWKKIYDQELLYSGPLFTHQLSHMWIDFRGLRDAFMREHGSDYFENSRQATYVQQAYAVHNPMQFEG